MRRNTYIESTRAPGLPNFPSYIKINSSKAKILGVSSINYDYIPMNLDSPKMLWVDLIHPAPRDLSVKSPVILYSSPYSKIQTLFNRNSSFNSIFQVDDIIGSRLVLSPYKGSTWLPTVHSSCDSPFGWGYDTDRINVSTSKMSIKYGYGAPIAFIKYFPSVTPSEITRIEASRIEDDWYRGNISFPGWKN